MAAGGAPVSLVGAKVNLRIDHADHVPVWTKFTAFTSHQPPHAEIALVGPLGSVLESHPTAPAVAIDGGRSIYIRFGYSVAFTVTEDAETFIISLRRKKHVREHLMGGVEIPLSEFSGLAAGQGRQREFGLVKKKKSGSMVPKGKLTVFLSVSGGSEQTPKAPPRGLWATQPEPVKAGEPKAVTMTRGTPFDVATWNVLHRVYAQQPANESNADIRTVLRQFPLEKQRWDSVIETVTAAFQEGTAVFCLQEVSGDLLAFLRHKLPPNVILFAYRLPRVPVNVEGTPSEATLFDRSEHLVTLVLLSQGGSDLGGCSIDDTSGLSFLEVRVGKDVHVFNTVVSRHSTATNLEPLRNRVQQLSAGGCAVVAGDLNGPRSTLRGFAGPEATWSNLASSERKTRGHTVADHVVGFSAEVSDATVLPCDGVSDHCVVRARVTPLSRTEGVSPSNRDDGLIRRHRVPKSE
mmetsp:Transcript_26123/g.60311  ORF Transcript_26123/g.60311 Transcript_26123/m.60311 type:complete len:463 (-) Transcript_26123:13-1401(-)